MTTATPQTGATIVADNLSKWYGSVVAVNEVSLSIGPGITGLLGPNGAGKTTLLRMMSGLASPSEGEVTVLGAPVRNNPSAYSNIGVMTEHDALYEFQTGRQFVALSARLHGLDDVEGASDAAIQAVNLASVQGRAIGGYSRGMRQRIRLAAAIVHMPPVIFLDEPLSGTDPRQRIEFQEFLLEYGRRGNTVIVSSHILEEVELLADRILLMIDGKLAAAGDYRAIRAKLDERPYKVLVQCSDARRLGSVLLKLEGVESVSVDGDALTLHSRSVDLIQRSIPAIARDENIRLLRVEPLDDSLESVFSYLVQS